MVEITLDTTKFQYLSTFVNIMGKTAEDVEINKDVIIYYVPLSEYRDLFDKTNRIKLKLLERIIKKRIIVKPFANDPIALAKIVLGKLAQQGEIYIARRDDGSKILRINIYGKKKINPIVIKKLKTLMRKYFPDIKDIKIN